jgi:hypothetical protein
MIFFTNTFNQTLTGLSAVWLTGVACGTGNLSDQRPKSTATDHFFLIFVFCRKSLGFSTLSHTHDAVLAVFLSRHPTIFGREPDFCQVVLGENSLSRSATDFQIFCRVSSVALAVSSLAWNDRPDVKQA